MFDTDELIALFKELGKIAADSNHSSKSAVELLSKEYLIYLNKKLVNPENQNIKPGYFKSIIKSLIGKLAFDADKMNLIYNDLNDKQTQHIILLQADNTLPDLLQNYYDDAFHIALPNMMSSIPLKTGFQYFSSSNKAMTMTKSVSISDLFENDQKNKELF